MSAEVIVWKLEDGTLCHLSKVAEREWEARVEREGSTLRAERFHDLAIAVAAARGWFAEFSGNVEPAG